MIDEADADGSGSINFPEFIELMLKKQAGGQTKDEIKQVRNNHCRNEMDDHLNFDHHINKLLRNCNVKYSTTFLLQNCFSYLPSRASFEKVSD